MKKIKIKIYFKYIFLHLINRVIFCNGLIFTYQKFYERMAILWGILNFRFNVVFFFFVLSNRLDDAKKFFSWTILLLTSLRVSFFLSIFLEINISFVFFFFLLWMTKYSLSEWMIAFWICAGTCLCLPLRLSEQIRCISFSFLFSKMSRFAFLFFVCVCVCVCKTYS